MFIMWFFLREYLLMFQIDDLTYYDAYFEFDDIYKYMML